LALDTDKDDPGRPTTPKALVATALWASTTKSMSEMARATGRERDAERYSTLHQEISREFARAFVGSDGQVGNGSQASYILSLFHNLVPDALRPTAAKNLASDIKRRGNVLSTGVVGTPHSLDVLVDTGYADLAYSLLLRTDYPSWGYMAKQGATTIWEAWDSDKRPRSSSRNHCALGSIGAFLYRRVAGIASLEPGFGRLQICPTIDSRIRRGGGRYDSVRGPIAVDWRQWAGGTFSLRVEIPANVSARVLLPSRFGNTVREGGGKASRSAHVRYLGTAEAHHHLEIGSGKYAFEVG
jgi:alpha-L-rhamnosidase